MRSSRADLTASLQPADRNAGAAYAALAYCLWGAMPLYWRLLDGIPPFELTVHRVLWCAVFASAVTLLRGRISQVVTIARTPRLFAMLALTSVLISVNWTLYIYCVAENILVEASLGYYMTPLVLSLIHI